MNIKPFDNSSGEGVIDFEPWRVSGPEYDLDHSRWYCHLTVNGKCVFEYGCPCGTCGIVFRKVGATDLSLTDTEAVELLGNLHKLPSESILKRLAKVLPKGQYLASILEQIPVRIKPGLNDDYFATDVVRLSGLEPPENKAPADPKTIYYKFGESPIIKKTGRLNSPHKALITSVIMPLHDPEQLNRDRIEYWKSKIDSGLQLTAFTISVIDNQSPAMEPADASYEYEEQFLLANCLIDGHHRVQAAAEKGVPIRLLSLLAKEYSLVGKPSDFELVLKPFLFK